MQSTLLAVDDSVTMRRILEITFASPEFRVVSASTVDAALEKLKTEKPDLVIADLSLDPKTGYDLCKAVKQASPSTPVLLLSSKQNAYDAGKGSSVGADDFMDKPFDTQQMIDKVKKLLQAGGEVTAGTGAGGPYRAAPEPAAAAPVAAAPVAAAPAARAPAPAAAAPAAAAPAAAPPGRAKTLVFNPGQSPAAHAAAPPAGSPLQRTLPGAAAPPAARPVVEAAPTPAHGIPQQKAAPVAAFSAQVNGQLAGQLEALGLTPAQADAVMALSREVVERVVWEVVPVLAETMIKEEIARLTK